MKKLILSFISIVFGLAIFSCKVTETEYVEVEKEKIVEVKDETPPAAISEDSVSAVAGDSSVLLSWTNPCDEDFFATKITYKAASEEKETSLLVEGKSGEGSIWFCSALANGSEYTFTLTALDKNANESISVVKKATPVSGTDTTPPANVTNLTATNKVGTILLNWTDASDADIFGYEVYCAESVVAVIPQGKGSCYVNELTNGTEYSFTVKSVDKSGNRSDGATVQATPEIEHLAIKLTVPSDGGDDGKTITLSNTSAQVNVVFSSTAKIAKAVWKTGEKDKGVKAADFLADSEAEEISVSEDGSATFTVTESGWYDVVAIDDLGHSAWEQVEVKTIDKVPPLEVSGLSINRSDDNVVVSWTDPEKNGDYDSPLNHIKITYTLNETGEEQTAAESVLAGTQTSTFSVPSGANSENNDYFMFKIVTVDDLGNTSDGVTWKFYPDGIFVKPSELATCISNLTNSAKITVTAEEDFTQTIANNAGNAMYTLYNKNNDILIDLDLSFITGMMYLRGYSSFSGRSNPYSTFDKCKSLQSVVLSGSLTSVGSYAFLKCENLRFVTISNSITKIGDFAFCDCYKLTSVEIPNSMNTFGMSVFYDCKNLSEIKFAGTKEQWNAIIKGDYWNKNVPATKVVCSDGEVSLK